MDRHDDIPSTATEYDAPRIARRARIDDALIGIVKLSDPAPSAAFGSGA